MLEYTCTCGEVFAGDNAGELLVEAVDHADQVHGMTDARAQAAVQVLDGLGFPASRAA
jgi:predicted small metal-binding protein